MILRKLLVAYLLAVLVAQATALDSTQWGLPKGAKARLGKGQINGNIAYSPDGTRLAVASVIGIWLYDTAAYQEIALLTGLSGVRSVVFSLDGSTLASVGDNNTLRLLDALTGANKQTFTGHTGNVLSVAFSPDGKTLASGSEDHTVRLWDVTTGVYKGTLTGPTGVTSLAFSPDGRILASGRRNNSIHLWDALTGEHKQIFTGHTGDVRSVAFSPDGDTLASASLDSTIRLWDVMTGQHKHILTGHTRAVRSVAFSPDGNILASASGDSTIRLWDVMTGQHKHTLTRHIWGVHSVAFSPDGDTLASASGDSTIRLWDGVTGEYKRALMGHRPLGGSVAFNPSGQTFACGMWNNLFLWRGVIGGKQTLGGHNGEIRSVVFSPEGKTLASASGHNTIHLWDGMTGGYKQVLRGHTEPVYSIAFSSDGNTLASASLDSTIRLWDVMTGEHKQTLTGHTWRVLSVAFSPDGDTLASGGYDGTVLLWEIAPFPDVNTTVSVMPSPVSSPAIGQQLTLSLNIEGGENVAGYQVTVGFDLTALRHVESANGDYLPAGAFFVPPVVAFDRVTLAATSLVGESEGEGTLATLTFEVIDLKTSTLTLSDVILSDSAGQTSLPRVLNGQVIEPPQIEGDVNRDGVVDILDLVEVAKRFNQTGEHDADVNGDGVVNIVDLVKVAGALTDALSAPSVHPQELTMLTTTDVQGWLTQAQGLDFTDATLQRGILFLEQLLAVLTPKETALLPNYPNPFNPETWIPYHLAYDVDVTLTIYDIKGTMIRQLNLGHKPAGYYSTRANAAYWDGRSSLGEVVGSGVYFYQLLAGDFSAMRKMVILK